MVQGGAEWSEVKWSGGAEWSEVKWSGAIRSGTGWNRDEWSEVEQSNKE